MYNEDNNVYQGLIISSIIHDRSIGGQRHMNCRRSHGFIVKIKGETEYRSGDRVWTLSEGQVLFVERGSSYYIREITPGYSFIVNFESEVDFGQSITRLALREGADIAPNAEKMYRYWQKGSIYGALSSLYAILSKLATESDGYISPRDRILLEPVVDYLNEHITDPELNMEQLKVLSNVSDAYLRRVFKRRYGIAPAGYVIRERLRLACQLLVSGEESSISEIATAVGYHDALYFSRIFKKQMGVSPTDYRREHTEDLF